MDRFGIPTFNIHGVLPPIRPGEASGSSDRAPYQIEILTFCQHFGGTVERRKMLRHLLDLRADFRGVEIIDGFQWLNGSFAEDVENLRGRSPQDIDVVTFAALGTADMQRERVKQAPKLFDSKHLKATYCVDHYFMQLDETAKVGFKNLVYGTAYWYSMWAHQRETQRWKGFVSVALRSNDEQARTWLDQSEHDDGVAS